VELWVLIKVSKKMRENTKEFKIMLLLLLLLLPTIETIMYFKVKELE
jgi:hypothetical protein